jgi:hypothetical protein
VAIGVIDILPLCVSSVYLIWDPDWAWASLGKVCDTCSSAADAQISALHEIALARDMARAGAPYMQYLYMGMSSATRYGDLPTRLLHPLLPKNAIQRRVPAVIFARPSESSSRSCL